MRLSALALCLVLVAGAHAAPLAGKQAPAPKLDGGKEDRPDAPVPEIPPALAEVDVTKLAPAISVLPQITMSDTMGILNLVPKLNITWVKEALPYTKNLDAAAVGKLGAAIIEPIQKIAPSTLGALVPAIDGADPKAFAELIPLVATLDVNSVKKLVPAINGFSPETLAKVMKLATALTPETYNALANVVNLGVPGINLMAAKLNMLPVAIEMPAPAPYKEAPKPAASPKPWSLFNFNTWG